jgi:hypothetical protein
MYRILCTNTFMSANKWFTESRNTQSIYFRYLVNHVSAFMNVCMHSILHAAPLLIRVGRDSSVGIATGYGLDGSGIESRWGQDFPQPSRPALRLTRPGRGVDHQPPYSDEVKERIGLYISSPSGPFWPVLRWTSRYFTLLYCNLLFFM